ncbi:SpoIIE family protein phosphatase [candidate division KSB1 bacterium]|nr:SpoIIE family protein phosphatase [candidate division KSB1 bacterium]NIS28144.1 SpoIIE family protein phosphatase [candidate division KSB1 bacterium]NIV96481.1 SpoIIE family protein phosphatase [candidate division KSB1 bacterium]NIW73337.1 SpoIIE family protein phosphatase [candidate division KSB1 bacterium]
MDRNILNRFRRSLMERRESLLEWFRTSSDTKKEQICCAQADELPPVVTEIDNALTRIDRGDFGRCVECDEDVEVERLQLDFTTCVCLGHYSDDQLQALEHDLELAAKVQQQLLPTKLPALPGAQLAVHSQPARIVSGDYFDFFADPSGGQGLVIADVMGKGLGASMLMSNLQASLRILGPEHKDLQSMATRLNELFRYNLKLIRFISIFLAKLDLKQRTLQYCNAGHHPPLWWEAATQTVRWLKPTGPAIGLIHTPDYRSETVRFNPGDILVMYTDGLVEARNGKMEEFGEDRLAQYTMKNFHRNAEDFLQGLRQNVAQFSDNKFHDDITIKVVKFE